MKFQMIIEILKQRMAEVNLLPVFLLTVLILIILIILIYRYGAGFFFALFFVLSGLLLINSEAVAGIVLVVRFPLVLVLVVYTLFSQKNKVHLSKAMIFWGVLPIVMFINSSKTPTPIEAMGESIVYLLFYIGLILGGQKILGDARGRSVYTKTIMVFTILVSCLQLPFLASSEGRLAGVFQTTVGYMIVGMAGVIILTWYCLDQKLWSAPFIFSMFFAGVTFTLLLLTGGRTAMIGALLGILVLLIRRLKRNLLILLACIIILGPIGLKLVVSFPGFENVKAKLFSTKDTRSELWKLAWIEIKAKPWTGWGTGTAVIKSSRDLGMTYHQTYLEFAVDLGIPFAIYMMIIFLWLPIRGLILMRKCPTEELKNMANLSAAILTGYVFSSFFAGVLNATTFILPIYSIIALMEGVYAESKEIEMYGNYEYIEEENIQYGSM
jgi:O-antigen ligase